MAIQEIDQRPPKGPRVISVNGNAVDEYPQSDFRISLPAAVTAHIEPCRISLSVRLWRYLRKLIRQRQESSAVKLAQRDSGQYKAQAVLAERQAEARVQKVEREKADLSKQIRDLQAVIDGKDYEILKGQKQIEVQEKQIEYMDALYQVMLTKEMSKISVHNRLIAEAELGERRTQRAVGEQE